MLLEIGKVVVDSAPDNLQINREVSVRHAIAHCVDQGPGNFGMLACKFRIRALDVSGSLAENLDVANHTILD